MKLLKIENNLGYFLDNEGRFSPIDKLTKNDLLNLVNLTLGEDAELDEYSEDLLKNQAHQIIYKSIYEKLVSLSSRKQSFIDESERQFLQECERYREEPTTQAD